MRNPRRECMLLPPRINVHSENDDTSDEEVANINKSPLSVVSKSLFNRNYTTMFRGFSSTSTPMKPSNTISELVVKVERLSAQQISRLSTNISSRTRRAATPNNLKEPNLKVKLRNTDYKEPKIRKRTTRKKASSESSDNERKARLRGTRSESSDND